LATTTSAAPARPVGRGDEGPLQAGGPPRAGGCLVSAGVHLSVRPVVAGRPSVSGDRILRWRLPDPPDRVTADLLGSGAV
jgi:hypothetical protein